MLYIKSIFQAASGSAFLESCGATSMCTSSTDASPGRGSLSPPSNWPAAERPSQPTSPNS